MPEIDDTFAKIDTFLDTGGAEHSDILVKVLHDTMKIVKRAYVDRELDDEPLVARIDAVVDRMKVLETSPPTDPVLLKQEFRAVALEMMACRRVMMPLQLDHRPGETVDPLKTLYDDEDLYAFAIYDSLAEEVTKLINALQEVPASTVEVDGAPTIDPASLRFAPEHFQDALPHDAIRMSRSGVAHGYDDFYYGERWQADGKHPGRPIAQINAEGVQILVLTPEEKLYLAKMESVKQQELWRLAILHDKFTKWEELRPDNYDYLLSVLWLPADPLSAMEIIAVMASS